MLDEYIVIKDEVKEALENNKPVVALESTIIGHGMPYPENIKVALEVENIVRENGAIPATIAILDGKLKVGLSKEEIEYLGKSDNIYKVSRRDLPFVVAKGLDGATTVAATMIIAEMAGIKVSVEVENIVRENGAIPATIAILDGKLKVGLSKEEIEYLGKSDNIYKVSRRDLPFVVAKGLDGATTVAATMIIAEMAGIKVF